MRFFILILLVCSWMTTMSLVEVAQAQFGSEQLELNELANARRLLTQLELKVRTNPILRDRVEAVRENVAAREARLAASNGRARCAAGFCDTADSSAPLGA